MDSDRNDGTGAGRGGPAGRDAEGEAARERVSRREAVAAEMRSFHINERARSGRVRVRGRGSATRPLARQDQIAASITGRAGTELARFVSRGMRWSESIRRLGATVERVAAEDRVHPLTVLHGVTLYDADCAGLLCHTSSRFEARPFTMAQAEIAAGIRGVDGEFCGLFTGISDTRTDDGRSANLGEI